MRREIMYSSHFIQGQDFSAIETETEIGPNGTTADWDFRGDSPEAIQRGIETVGSIIGGKPVEPSSRGGTFFGRNSWNVSWEPKGPKKHWKIDPPEDPTNN